MTSLESKANTIHGVLALLSRAAGSDGFQVDVRYFKNSAKVVAYLYNGGQAAALAAFVKEFVWSEVGFEKTLFAGWVVTITIKEEETK